MFPLRSRAILWHTIGIVMVLSSCFAAAVSAMPAQVMIIRHAEKYVDRAKAYLNPRGLTRAKALAQFFQSDQRVLEYGLPAAIIAQVPNMKKKSVRCEETVEPLAQAIGRKLINRFEYGRVAELAEWLRSGREWDGKSVLVCLQHSDIVPLAKALGVSQVLQSVWPHETYDRVWLIDFSQKDGGVVSFRDIPQRLLFGDSFQDVATSNLPGSVSLSQTYRDTSPRDSTKTIPTAKWKCRVAVEIPGDFSEFDDETIPVLRLGGFTFGYYATTLGKLRENKNAEVKIDGAAGSGSLRYNYQTTLDGVEQTYAWVTFSWDKESLKAEFLADVDEAKVSPDLNMPVEFHVDKPEGIIIGASSCFVAFGKKRFHAPAGLSYRGNGNRMVDVSNQEVYEAMVVEEKGVVVEARYLPEL